MTTNSYIERSDYGNTPNWVMMNNDCQIAIKKIPDNSVDCILTDPPYLYLKNQKLEREFNEDELFAQFKRILKPTGFVVIFGRGESFYRWNYKLSQLGLQFKEEVIWDKGHCTSPLMRLSRVHETIAVHAMPKATINKVKIPYLEAKVYNIEAIRADINRLNAVLSNAKSLQAVDAFLENHCSNISGVRSPNNLTISSPITQEDRCASVMRAMQEGMREKSIIKQTRDHYNAIHPTQKPVRLLERLLALTTKPGDVVFDPFAGSCSTAIACINTGREFIGCEIDKEYYWTGVARTYNHIKQFEL